jgi:cystathionine gamma-synthase
MSKANLKYLRNSIVTPIFQTATYSFENTLEVIDYHEGKIKTGRYGRYDNPNWLEVESTIASLDNNEEALVFPSGMSAIATTFISFLEKGDNIVYTGKGYKNIRGLCGNILGRLGIESKSLSPGDADQFMKDFDQYYNNKTKIVFLEIPSNPHMHLVDVEAIKNKLSKNTLLIVDSTFSSPINFQPQKYGADLVIHSCSKYMGGHADILAGSVSGRKNLISVVRENRNVLGSIIGPLSAFLLNRSLATLKIRMEYLNRAGMKVAKYLRKHPKIKQVFYTGDDSHPQYDLAKKYLTGHGGVISFEIDSPANEIPKFIDKLQIPFMGTNFGSQHSMVEQCSVFTYYKSSEEEKKQLGITGGLIRLSLGFNDPKLVIEDIENALKVL